MGTITTEYMVQLAGLLPPRWVRLTSATTQPFISNGPSDPTTGQAFFTGQVPNGTYTLATAPSPNGPTWTVEDAAYVVASNPPTGVITDKGGMVFNVNAYTGATGDAQFQAANNAAAVVGGTVYGPPGAFSFNASLLLDSGVTLWLDPECIITRNFSGTGTQLATIKNRHQTTSDNDISLIGGQFTTTNAANTGRHLGFINVNRLLVTQFRIVGVKGDWNTGFENNTNFVIDRFFINSGTTTGTDGIHVRSGQFGLISNGSVASGDDCIALEQGTNTGDAGQALGNLSDIAVVNIAVHSLNARAFIVDIDGTSTGTIRRVTISNIVGTQVAASAYTFEIGDLTAGTFSVQDVAVDNVQIDCSGQPSTGAGGDITNVARVWLDRVNLASTAGTTFRVNVSSDIWLKSVEGTPRNAGTNHVNTVGSNTNINVQDSYLSGAPQAGINYNGVTGGSIRGNKVTGSGTYGIVLNTTTTGVRVLDNQVTLCTNFGVYELGSSDHNIIALNDLRGNTGGSVNTPTLGAHSIYAFNDGFNPQGVAAITPGASPYTYTNADAVMEAIYIFGGTVTTVVKNGITIFSHGGAAVPGDTVWLAQNEAVTVTYTVVPTMNKDRK